MIRRCITTILLVTGIAGIGSLLGAGVHRSEKPRPRSAEEVPVAFWAWRNETPTQADVQAALGSTRGTTLFLRAGQFDISENGIDRIRSATGPFPAAPELHLVFNSTRKLLNEFESIDPDRFARKIADTYLSDVLGARAAGVAVHGLQLDIDVPTRLLPRYAEVLKIVRRRIPAGSALSITGLPTWASSSLLEDVLLTVDFWIPQCYGAKVPETISERIPISSAADVALTIEAVRRRGKPFYAGLSVYGYAILYGQDGKLIELRGDIAPESAWRSGLELTAIDRFDGPAGTGEVRYEYRARSDVVLDGLIVKSGEALVFNTPTAGAVNAAAKAVRDNAGEALLGICLFRLPSRHDKNTLGLNEIASALSGSSSHASFKVSAEAVTSQQLRLRVLNDGSAASVVSDGALSIDLQVPKGSVTSVTGLDGFSEYRSLCGSTIESGACSGRRADVVRLASGMSRPGSDATVTIVFNREVPAAITGSVTLYIDDGRVERIPIAVQVQNRGGNRETRN